MGKYTEILLLNPDNGLPVIDVHEYRGVLPEEQTLNYADVAKYHRDLADKKVSNDQLNDMLDNLLRQPIMESAYRRNGIAPSQVDDFIAQGKKLPEFDRKSIIDLNFRSYGNAALSEKGYDDGDNNWKLTISGEKEWDNLGKELIDYPSLKHLSFKMKQSAENTAPEVKPIEKEGFGKKIKRWFEKRKIDTKGMKNVAAGLAAAVILTPAAMKLMKLTAKEDFAKIAKNEQKTAQSQTQDMSKVYDMNKNVRS